MVVAKLLFFLLARGLGAAAIAAGATIAIVSMWRLLRPMLLDYHLPDEPTPSEVAAIVNSRDARLRIAEF